MSRTIITKEKIVLATMELAKCIGLSNVSFPRLAEYFEIKAPSLYNHFKNMTEVRIAVAVHLQKRLNEQLLQAMVGRTPVDAVRAYAETYKSFADEHIEVYELLNMIHQANNEELEKLAIENIRLLRVSLENFDLTTDEIFHRSRMFRSTLHGFITLSQLGYFQNSEAVSKELSFEYIVNQFVEEINNKKQN